MDDKKLKEVIKAFSDIDNSFKQFNSVMSSGPSSYYLEKLMGYYEGCMAAAKFKVGDKVKLTEDVDTSNAPGWEWAKHFMKKGAKAKISEVDYDDGVYVYHVIFNKETWLDDLYPNKKKPIERPVKNKHQFRFNGDRMLEKAK